MKPNRALPLELFDNPETELVPPEERLLRRQPGAPGVAAHSRYYDTQGHCKWAPCWVLQYNR